MRKRFYFWVSFFVVLILFFILLNNFSFGYGTTYSHPKLTREIVNLYNQSYSESQITQQEIEWLIKGAVEEDTPLRYINHFYDPIYNQPWLGRNPVALTAKDWAQSPNYQLIFAKGNQSWQKAIESYIKGDKKSSFIALGHILHLIEDMAVPEHTRNDTHLPYVDESPYEKWAEIFLSRNSISTSATLRQCSDLNYCFYSLSTYSNRNFFSKDTINKIYNSPIIRYWEREEIGEGKLRKYGYGVDNLGNKFRLVEGGVITWKSILDEKEVYKLDDKVLSDYFFLLSPQAISHGAGTIKLFFEEAEKQKQLEEQKSWWQKIKERTKDLFSATLLSLVKEEPAPSPAQPAVTPKEEEKETAQTEQTKTSPDNTLTGVTPIGVTQINLVSKPQAPKSLSEQPKTEKPEQSPITPKTEEPKQPESKPKEISKTPEKPSEQESSPSSEYQSNIITSSAKPSHHDEPIPEIPPDIQPSETYATSTLFANNQSVATSTAIFEFSSSEVSSTFECQLDSATSTICLSPKTYENLSDGTHTFQVRAIDQAGNQDESPATISWTIDITPPVLSNISASATRNSATIFWISSETGIFQISYGTSTNYGFVTATTSNTTLSISSLSVGTTYHYQIQAQDQVSNSTASPDSIFTTSAQAVNIMISEIQINGTTTLDEFVELYNPTNSDINLAGWRLTKKTASGATTENLLTTFPNKIIPAFGYFLIAHPTDYDGGVVPDAVYSTTASIAPNNTVILYSDAGQTIVDLVGLGNATIFEGLPIDNPLANYSIERKANAFSTAESLAFSTDKWLGNAYDTDNNSQDFVLQDSPTPQNSLMLSEPRISLPNLANSSWPMFQKDPRHTGQSAALSLATSTMTIKWSLALTPLSRPVLDEQGNIYLGTTNGLAKISPAGTLLWLYATSSSYTTPLIASDNTIYFRGFDGLYAITKDRQLKWRYPLSGVVGGNAALNITSEGAIITQVGEKIYAINQDATLKWIFNPGRSLQSSGAITASTIDQQDNVYVAIGNYLYAISNRGALLWEKNVGNFLFSTSVLGTNNTLYLTAGAWPSGAIYALNPSDGSVRWADTISGYNNHADLAPALDANNNIYTIVFTVPVSIRHQLQKYSAGSQSPLWAVGIDSSEVAAPILTQDNKIYLAERGTIRIFDCSNGSLIYTFSSPNGSDLHSYFGAIGADGTIYTGALYAIGN